MSRDRCPLAFVLPALPLLFALGPCASAEERPIDAAVSQSGTREYCEPEHAFALGDAGESYQNTCPGSSASAFHDSYYAGRRLFLEASEIAELEDALATRVRELIGVDTDLAAIAERSTRADATERERGERFAERERLADARRDLAAEIDGLELELRSRKDDLAARRQNLADND